MKGYRKALYRINRLAGGSETGYHACLGWENANNRRKGGPDPYEGDLKGIKNLHDVLDDNGARVPSDVTSRRVLIKTRFEQEVSGRIAGILE